MNKGYTLIEVLISVLVFSLISGAAFGVFALALRVQKYSLASQQLLAQTSYAMEYMSRAMRMAKRDDMGCIDGSNYDNPGGDTSRIKFLDYKGECLEFFWEDTSKQLKVNRWKDGARIFDAVELVSDDFEIVSPLNFEISGDEPGDNSQPRVTIYMEIKGKSTGYQPKIKIQTTISQRNLDI